MSRILNITNHADRAEITIYGDIGEYQWWTETVSDAQVAEELRAAGGKPITVRINSMGGNLYQGIAIYNALKGYENEVSIYVDGLAASAASLVMLGGDKVFVGHGAQVMIHDPILFGAINESELERIKNSLEKAKESIIEIYEANTSLTREQISEMMRNETWFTSQEAIDYGFADAISDQPQSSALLNSLREMVNQHASYKPIISNIIQSITPKQKGDNMGKNATNSGKTATTIDPDAIRNQAIEEARKAEEQRRTEIINIFSQFPALKELQNKCLLNSDITVEEAKDKLLNAVAEGEHVTVVNRANSLSAPQVSVDNVEQGITEALRNRAAHKYDPTNEYSSITPTGLLVHIANRHGLSSSVIGRSNQVIVDSLIGNPQVMDDFQVKMGDYVHRLMQFAYEEASVTYQRFTRNRELKDFRAHELYARGALGNLELRGNDGNYKVITLPDDEKQSYKASEYGGIVQIDRTVLINDEWGTIDDQAMDGGTSTARTVEALVYHTLLSNPILADGKPLFDESRGNVLNKGRMTEEAWHALVYHYETLTAPNSPSAFLNVNPEHILTDAKGFFEALELITKETGKEAKSTVGMFERENIIKSPYMRNKPEIYLGDTPIVEVGWIGAPGPKMLTEQHFNSGTFRSRIQADVGVGITGWRGAAISELTEEMGQSRSFSAPINTDDELAKIEQARMQLEQERAALEQLKQELDGAQESPLNQYTIEQLKSALDDLEIDYSNARTKKEYIAIAQESGQLENVVELLDV